MILENVSEHSGLQKGREYTVQAASVWQEEDGRTRRLQPDAPANLSGSKQIVIDPKASLTAYAYHAQTVDAETTEHEFAAHITSIRAHVRNLSQRDYTDLEGINMLGFALMFVPVESTYPLALQHDAGLLQECFDKRIVLAGPSTLLATLHIVANLWCNEQQNQNALAVAEEGDRPYDKFIDFTQMLENVGKNMAQAQSQFRATCKQFSQEKGSPISRAEKLRALGVKAGKRLDKSLVGNS